MATHRFSPQIPSFPEGEDQPMIRIAEKGPYIVYGRPEFVQLIIKTNEQEDSVSYVRGVHYESQSEPCALCRCGMSSNKPFCDCSHENCEKDLAEVSPLEGYLERAEWTEGESVVLSDDKSLCAFASFCGTWGSAWERVKTAKLTSHEPDNLFEQVAKCPSGRLMIWDKQSGELIEASIDPQIAFLEKEVSQLSGPIWVRGGIKIISASGLVYERRTRVTLCRCGASGNKPFCDGTHEEIQFCDELELGDDCVK